MQLSFHKAVRLIFLPYDSAHFNECMGAGPLHIINSGLIQKLQQEGYEVVLKEILLREDFPTEITSTFNLLIQLQKDVAEALQQRSFPIILSGNCCATVGVIAGINSEDVGVVWFDAHGDCETPETTTSGFLDGMGLSLLTDNCRNNLRRTKNLGAGLPGKNIVLIGARDLSEYEKKFISINDINHISVERYKHKGRSIIQAACAVLVQTGIKKIHLHIDVDMFDSSVGVANSYAVENGLYKEDVIEIINECISILPSTSVTIGSYDPSFDPDGRMLKIINELIAAILKHL